ncbi:diguanylate cyclase [Marinomonas sp. IMCC 4694]|uniref:diguanylate cyclase n=1 Tax=Marinomonas sp. IMCC 4694 TaxID=2605432 RepID=UPI0011E6458D|nr:diguanylate cyclase [Marinomonas sp. IMCC 4694]TYL46574.1 diguanylate cyclase [Marinomonas sp. IMCC 4694]
MKNSQKGIAQWECVLNTMPIAVGLSCVSSGQIAYVNRAFTTLFGLAIDDLNDVASWFAHISAQPDYYPRVVAPWVLASDAVSSDSLDMSVLCLDGAFKQINVCFSTLNGKRLWYFNDITDHWVAEERLRARSQMLEMVAKSSALSDILNVIVEQIQQESPSSLCSILLFDQAEQRLVVGSAPNLPDFYNQEVDGLKIGMNVGSCGTAAHLNERVVVGDIASHEYWENYAELAKQAGVAACWSDPIMSSKGDLLGTFAIYKSAPSLPSEKDFELIHFASSLASIAIESFRAQEALEKRAYYDHLTGLANRGYFFQEYEKALNNAKKDATPLSIIMMDVDNFKRVNDGFGHKIGDVVLQKLAETCRSIVREGDMVARVGGEEFAILVPLTEQKDALKIAEQLRHEIERCSVLSAENQPVNFTVSMGVCSRGDTDNSVDELLNKADKALYRAKAAGKNCVFTLELYSDHPLV